MSEVIEDGEVAVTCDDCASVIVDESCTTYDGSTVCEDCMQVCGRCDNIFSRNESFYGIDGDYSWWCQHCTESYASYCEHCEERHTGGNTYVTDRDIYVCDSCADGYNWCDECEEYNRDECESCQESAGRTIHDYSYRPDPIFHGEGRLFFGIEIETEAPRGDRNIMVEAAKYAYQLEENNLAYLKSDGSLQCGFEIVTHPMTHDFYMNKAPLLWDTIAHLRDEMKMRAWSTGTCGLHIHISRAGFNNGSHMHRFLQLIYGNQTFYARLAGRESSRWATFDDVSRYDTEKDKSYNTFKDKIERGDRTNRYSAVNTQNRHTLEMRIFRGTVNSDTIKSAIDLAHASVEYTRRLTVSQVRDGALERMNFVQYIHDNKAIYPNLLTRLDKLFVASDSE
jgi:Putative amidoligase enzyme